MSELTRQIKSSLEGRFSLIWITGEISNFSTPSSGHFYFSIKDPAAQIRSVMFRGQNRMLRFVPENGMHVTGFGRVSVYEPRGTYQFIFEYLEPKGRGALQAAFEQLKQRLDNEGIFDPSRKRPIPFLPRCICLITSPTGAVVHDMVRILLDRFPNCYIEILPVKVQGSDAEFDIAGAIQTMNLRQTADVGVIARGGGSLEDLAAFNSETVARAIAASRIPVVSAVGHETDYTIADFTADLRAPTPSAAAEMVMPRKADLQHLCVQMRRALTAAVVRQIVGHRQRLELLQKNLGHPRRRIQDFRLRLEDLATRLQRQAQRMIAAKQDRFRWLRHRMHARHPGIHLAQLRQRVRDHHTRLMATTRITIERRLRVVQALQGKLAVLDPSAVLSRGYSITSFQDTGRIVRDSRQTPSGTVVDIRLHRGRLAAVVRTVTNADPGDTGA